MRKFLKVFFKIIAMILYRVEKVGEENIPKEGSFILCGNHISLMDAPILILFSKRKISFMAKEELFKNKIIAWACNIFGAFPVKRGVLDVGAMKKSLEVLKSEEVLGIFPEGTRNGLKDNKDAKNGTAYLAIRTGVPVIPVGIIGSFKPFTKVKLNFGVPLDFTEYKSKKPDKEIIEKVTEIIMNDIIMLTNVKK